MPTITLRLVCRVAALGASALLSPIARADVYKCAGNGGVPIYQEMPCAAGKELRNFQTDPPPITVLPAQPAIAAPAAPPPPKAGPANGTKDRTDAKPGKSARSAGDASERKHVRLGMTEAEVLARVGHPEMTTGGRGGGPVRWTYLPAPGDPETTTAVVLTKGVVTDIERTVVKK